MSKSIKYNYVTYVFLWLFFFYGLISNNKLFAQGPKSPEASSFEPVDATDMVNLATGDLSYVLPLINIPSPEGGYPLAISYHAGIAMEQEASWVGLGWSLNPGAINRNVSGQPDDWKDGLNSTITKNIGGTSTYDSFFVGVGWGDDDKNSIGVSANFTTNRAFGGETSHSYSINATANINNQSYGIGYSSNGNFSANYNNFSYNSQSGMGIGLGGNLLTDGDGNSISGGVNLSQKNGLGISLSASGGASFSIVGDNNRTSSNSSSALSAMRVGDKFSINASIGPLRIGYSRQKIKYWHFDEKTYGSTGLLYAGELNDILDGNNGYFGKVLPHFHEFDSAESVYKAMNSSTELASNNPTFVSYDQYDISAQGITASMTPYILETGLLHNAFSSGFEGSIIINGNTRDLEGLYYYNKNDFSKSIDNPIESKRINFQINNELSSYYNLTSSALSLWQYSNNYSGEMYGFSETVAVPNTITQQGYVANKNRLKQSSFIESYTNRELLTNPLLILNANINRTNLDQDGIGAFKITVADGKIYHYSIPVYQKEKFSRTAKYNDNINEKFTEQQSLSPYATHWLLTGITGPDYIDINGNNELDEDDYGYWVKFDYGKWSDGFSWRIPASGYTYGSNSKSYSWGVKEIYYLNSIKTRSHTAFFIKELRNDYNSINGKVGTSRSNPNSNTAVYYSYQNNLPLYRGTDGKIYFPGAYSTISTSSAPYSSAGYSVYEIINRQYAESFNHKTLRLKEIILLKNTDIPSTLNMLNPQSTPKLASDMIFDEKVNLVGDDEYSTGFIAYVDSQYFGEYYSNVIDNNDSDFVSLKNKAVKVIGFKYDYSLATNSPNSVNSGKLTLKSLHNYGKQGVNIIPPYTFSYNNLSYSSSQIDEWGYKKFNPENGSLKQIKTPTGASLDIQYESDDYAYEAATKNLVLDFNLQLKFTGTSDGDKYLEVRNHINNDSRQNIDFREFFKVGEFDYIDVQYWWNPDHNGAHRVADIANECLVISVSQNQVKFKLPNIFIGNDVRRDANCQNEVWTFYRWYNEVVSRTSNWREELREFHCGEPGNDNDKVKIKLFSRLNNSNLKGGGIRVKNIIVDGKYITKHYYNKPGTSVSPNDTNYESSGVTSFAPSKHFKEIPYGNYIPGPGVIYEYVTVAKENIINEYHFNVLPKYILDGDIKYSLGNFFQITEESSQVEYLPVTVNHAYSNIPLKKSKFIISDKLSLLGSLINKKTYNNDNHQLLKVINNYESNVFENGIIQENFSSLERIYSRPHDQWPTTSDINLANTTKITYPLKLNSIKSTANNFETTTSFSGYDIQTGKALETITTSSYGRSYKTKTVPAYTKYSAMGNKVDNINNKNMLSQTAAEYSYILDNGVWKETGVGITTWNNIWSYKDIGGNTSNPASEVGVWRKHKTYIWNGIKDSNGIFTNYNNNNTDDDFVWGVGLSQTNLKWKQTSEITLYNHYSTPLEVKDINGNFASTKMGDNNTKLMASGNAGYNEMFYAGGEYISNGFWLEPEVRIQDGASRSQEKSHTGKYSISTNSSGKFGVVMREDQHRAGKYKLSVWVYKTDLPYARVNVDGTNIAFNGEVSNAGNWALLTHYFDCPITEKFIYVTSSSNEIFYDDLMIRPIASSVTGYVYNEFDELTFIIGNNGLATKFEYDAGGGLKETHVEVIDFSDGTPGGFKLKSKNNIRYKSLQ